VILDTPEGGSEGLFVQAGSGRWSRASPIEILESGSELSRSALIEMFPDIPSLEKANIICRTSEESRPLGGTSVSKNKARWSMAFLAWAVFWLGNIATFVKLTFFDGYEYTWWNWIIVVPINEFLAMMWPIYWVILRPLFGP
jgi:hypothetical protein